MKKKISATIANRRKASDYFGRVQDVFERKFDGFPAVPADPSKVDGYTDGSLGQIDAKDIIDAITKAMQSGTIVPACPESSPPPAGSTCSAFDNFERTYAGNGSTTGWGNADATGYNWNSVFTSKADPTTVFYVTGGQATIDLTGTTSANIAPIFSAQRNNTTQWNLPGEIEFEYQVENAAASTTSQLLIDTYRSELVIRAGLGTALLFGNDGSASTSMDLTGLQRCRLNVSDTETKVKLWPASGTEPTSWTMTVPTSNEFAFVVTIYGRASSSANNTKYHFTYFRMWSNGFEIDTCSTSEYVDGSHQTQVVEWSYAHDATTEWNRNDLETSWVRYRQYGNNTVTLQDKTTSIPGGEPDISQDAADYRVYQGANSSTGDASMWDDDVYRRNYWSFRKPTASAFSNLASVDSVRITGYLALRYSYNGNEHNGVEPAMDFDVEVRSGDWQLAAPALDAGGSLSGATINATSALVTLANGNTYNGYTPFDLTLNIPSGDFLDVWFRITTPNNSLGLPTFDPGWSVGHTWTRLNWEGDSASSATYRNAAIWTVTITDPASIITIASPVTGAVAVATATTILGAVLTTTDQTTYVPPTDISWYLDVYVDGILATRDTDYTVCGQNICFINALSADVEVTARYVT